MSGINIGLSVVKRENRDIDAVDNVLMQNGWNKTDTLMSGRLRYYEKSGINITALQGPFATLVFPSGPLRGKLFGEEIDFFSRQSVMGLGEEKTPDTKVQTSPNSDQLT